MDPVFCTAPRRPKSTRLQIEVRLASAQPAPALNRYISCLRRSQRPRSCCQLVDVRLRLQQVFSPNPPAGCAESGPDGSENPAREECSTARHNFETRGVITVQLLFAVPVRARSMRAEHKCYKKHLCALPSVLSESTSCFESIFRDLKPQTRSFQYCTYMYTALSYRCSRTHTHVRTHALVGFCVVVDASALHV